LRCCRTVGSAYICRKDSYDRYRTPCAPERQRQSATMEVRHEEETHVHLRSMNQTTQMHQISSIFPSTSTPSRPITAMALTRFCEAGIAGVHDHRRQARGTLPAVSGGSSPPHRLPGKKEPYDLVVTCSDVYFRRTFGQQDRARSGGYYRPGNLCVSTGHAISLSPLWLAGTAATGLSDAYRNSASPAKDIEISSSEKARGPTRSSSREFPISMTAGDIAPTLPHSHYVLVCTSPLREVFRGEDRKAFIAKPSISPPAGGSSQAPPDRNVKRATREISRYAPEPWCLRQEVPKR